VRANKQLPDKTISQGKRVILPGDEIAMKVMNITIMKRGVYALVGLHHTNCVRHSLPVRCRLCRTRLFANNTRTSTARHQPK